MAGLDFKHLDLMEEKNINEKNLPKNVQIKIAKFKIEKKKFDEDEEDEMAEAAASRLSDEIADMIETYLKSDDYKAKATPPKTPKAQIDPKEVETIIEQREARKAKEKLDADYANLISKADNALNNKAFEEAISYYTEASKLKPEEKYPADQVAVATKANEEALEAAKKAADELSVKERDEKYTALVAQADEAISAKKYAEAKSLLAEAQILKPEETYPAEQIQACDKAIADDEAAALATKKKQEEDDRKRKTNSTFETLGF